MDLLDELNKTVAGGVGRLSFEARRLQKTTRIQGEIFGLRQQLDAGLTQLGRRALDLWAQGQLNQQALTEAATALQNIEAQLAAKEQELRAAQAETYVEPAAPPPAQRVPIDPEPAAPKQRICPQCGTVCGPTSRFCPNCGTRVAD
jgi:hypothetical protein